jgi:hypothetical protein
MLDVLRINFFFGSSLTVTDSESGTTDCLRAVTYGISKGVSIIPLLPQIMGKTKSSVLVFFLDSDLLSRDIDHESDRHARCTLI